MFVSNNVANLNQILDLIVYVCSLSLSLSLSVTENDATRMEHKNSSCEERYLSDKREGEQWRSYACVAVRPPQSICFSTQDRNYKCNSGMVTIKNLGLRHQKKTECGTNSDNSKHYARKKSATDAPLWNSQQKSLLGTETSNISTNSLSSRP